MLYICNMKNIIYGLRSPLNDVYYYIGKSTVGSTRALSHLTNSHSDKVNEWVEGLNKCWLYPLVDIIEEVENINDLPNREKYWIEYHYSLNPNLLNVQLTPDNINETRTSEDNEKFNNLCYILTDISSILKKERLARNMTQSELAKASKVNRSTIVNLENNANISLRNIIKCVLALKGIDIKQKSIKQRVRRI